MKFAIISAGEGSRLSQEGVALPKPLVQLNGVTMILIQCLYDECSSRFQSFQGHIQFFGRGIHIVTEILGRRDSYFIPVSYTHLDVYKRQVYGRIIYSPEIYQVTFTCSLYLFITNSYSLTKHQNPLSIV